MAQFHINLNDNQNEKSGPLVSLDLEWILNGKFMQGRQAAVQALTSLTGIFADLKAVDRYLIIDGSLGAVLYSIGGQQIGPLPGIPDTGKSYNVLGGELMEYNSNAEVSYLITVQEQGVQAAELTGGVETKNVSFAGLERNPQTNETFRRLLKDNLRTIHPSVNAGNEMNNLLFVADDVKINADTSLTSGRSSFIDLLESDKSTFSNFVVHDDRILVDGHLGAIESVWQGNHSKTYHGPGNLTIPPTGKQVRMREFWFFSFDHHGLVQDITRVRDESAIAKQLTTDFVYP